MKMIRDELFPDAYIINKTWGDNKCIHINEVTRKYHVLVNREFVDGEYDTFEEAVKALKAIKVLEAV